MRDDCLDQDDSHKDGEKRMDSGYIFDAELTGLAGELDRGWELGRKGKGRKDVSYVFILNKQDGEQTLGDKWIG